MITLLRTYFKPILVWGIILIITVEILLHIKLNILPYKFLNHTSGPIRILSQYSKKSVIPKNFIALVGDSNVYGFGPWLYDNSWSMGQPNFATHHLLHQTLNQDIVAFGYPGFGNMGSSLTAVSEYKMLQSSWIWSEIHSPERILFVFYEGNDLINNLHEFEQRGFCIDGTINEILERKLQRLFNSEEERLRKDWAMLDHSATWNLLSGLFLNYFNRSIQTTEINNANLVSVKPNKRTPEGP